MKFYNPLVFKKILFKDNPDYDLFHLNRMGICKFDRTGLFTKFDINEKYNFRSDFNLPDFSESMQLDFHDVCLYRAQEILNENKDIILFWSGGLDSTTALIAFDRFKKSKSIITIILTQNSIIDNPIIFEDVIKHNYNYVILDDYGDIKDYYDINKLNVMGDVNEAVIGWSGILQIFAQDYGFDVIYKKISDIPKLKNMMSTEKYSTFDYFYKLYYSIEETFPACPIDIIDIQDLNFWFIFNFSWQYDYYRFMVPYYKNYKDVWNAQRPFFGTDMFQQWSIYNYYDIFKTIDCFNNYKIDEINFIKKYIPQSEFNNILPRKTNVPLKYIAPIDFLLIDDNYNQTDCPISLKPNYDDIIKSKIRDNPKEIQLLFD